MDPNIEPDTVRGAPHQIAKDEGNSTQGEPEATIKCLQRKFDKETPAINTRGFFEGLLIPHDKPTSFPHEPKHSS